MITKIPMDNEQLKRECYTMRHEDVTISCPFFFFFLILDSFCFFLRDG